MEKVQTLKDILRSLPGVLVAYSGGVDSTFLAVVAHEVLGDRALAVTAVSPTYPEDQLEDARKIAEQYGFRHQVITTDEFEDQNFTANPPDRCYYCKSALFQALEKIAQSAGMIVVDGANVDDCDDHRPGHRAARELGIRSLLQEAGFTKEEIRAASKKLGLPTWNKPAYACLASRIPYGREITPEILNRVDQAEKFLKEIGLHEFRVRDHYPVARLEIGQEQQDFAWANRKNISAHLHGLGFPYVTFDLDGFRSGSMNVVLSKDQIES